MVDIITIAEQSLERTLLFYENLGIPLSYKPTITYLDRKCEFVPGVRALVAGETNIPDRFVEIILREYVKSTNEQEYQLILSDKAIDEVVGFELGKVKKMLTHSDYHSSADITLFKPYETDWMTLKEPRLPGFDVFMAHEVWHLIEKERGVFNLFIKEGTATFAMRYFLKKGCNKPVEEFNDITGVYYFGCANIVQNHVAQSENPLTAILNLEIQLGIESEFLRRSRHRLGRLAKSDLDNPEIRKAVLSSYALIPEFKELIGNLTSERLIKAYRKLNLNTYADEIEKQDLSFLLDTLKKIGF